MGSPQPAPATPPHRAGDRVIALGGKTRQLLRARVLSVERPRTAGNAGHREADQPAEPLHLGVDEVVPIIVEVEVAVPRLTPAIW